MEFEILVVLLHLVTLQTVAVCGDVTAEKTIADRKIASALRLLTPQHCVNIGVELVNIIKQSGNIEDISRLEDLGLVEVGDVIRGERNWTVFQRRVDGSVTFYRGWDQYVNGFGNPRGEFWLGLESIHQLTKYGDQELEIELIEDDGTVYSEQYSYFKVGSASTNYALYIRGYTGNASETMRIHNNCPFTTTDSDHDNWLLGNCAYSSRGAWWYHKCGDANLNGRYDDPSDWTGLVWYHRGRGEVLHMRFTEMKFRRRARPYEQPDD